MTKILVSIACYGDQQVSYMQRQIAELRTGPFDLDIVVDATIDWSAEAVQVRRFPPSIGKGLPFAHRRLFRDRRGDYDVYLYLENDLLMPPAAIAHWLELTRRLPADYITGFVRYENRGDQKALIDIGHPWWDQHVEVGLHQVNGMSVFCPANVHAGCYALTRDQLEYAIRSRGFATRPHTRPFKMLEQGASDVYTQCGFRRKVLPYDFEPLLIHHMPDKYVKVDPRWVEGRGYTVDEFKRMVTEHDHAVTLPLMTRPRYWIYDNKKRIKALMKKVGLLG